MGRSVRICASGIATRLGECGVERGLADFDASGDLSNGEALRAQDLSALELFVRHDGLPTTLALSPGRQPATNTWAHVQAAVDSVVDDPSGIEPTKRARIENS
jgi:hypothetical protein